MKVPDARVLRAEISPVASFASLVRDQRQRFTIATKKNRLPRGLPSNEFSA